MPPTWQPSAWGKVLTSSGEWKLALDGDTITVTLGGVDIVTAVEDVEIIAVTRGLFWSRIELHVGEWVSRLYGIRSKDAAAFERAFATSLPKNSPQTQKRRSYGDLGGLDQRNGGIAQKDCVDRMAISTAPFELGMPIVQNAFNAAVDSSEQRPVAAREPIAY